MPVYDYGSVKEDVASSSSNRNWGYDPVNYNAPEGSYSTNPYDGNTRITEFKQMIQALHDRGISVVPPSANARYLPLLSSLTPEFLETEKSRT